MFGFGKKDWLDDRLLTYPDGSPFTVRDATRGISISGITGSGKTSGAIHTIESAIVAHPRSCIVALCQKPEEADDHCKILDRYGKPYKRIDASGKWKCNFIADELSAGADVLSLTEFATILGQGLKEKETGDQNPFYKSLERRILQNGIGPLALLGDLTFANLHRFISGAVIPTSKDPQEATKLKAEWEKGYTNKTLLAAKAAKKTNAQIYDFNVYAPFWSKEWQHADERTRGNGLAGVNNLMQGACTGLGMELTGTTSNASPRDIDDGISLIIDFPYTTYQETGRFIAGDGY